MVATNAPKITRFTDAERDTLKGGDWQGYLDAIAKEYAPIARFATPEELANFFVFRCSDRASYSVGSTYFVDGSVLKVVT